jgi:hypothetical protein
LRPRSGPGIGNKSLRIEPHVSDIFISYASEDRERIIRWAREKLGMTDCAFVPSVSGAPPLGTKKGFCTD